MTYTVTPMPEETVQQQREAFAALLENLGQASPAEVAQALAKREKVTPEPDLDPEVAARLQRRVSESASRRIGE